MKLLQSNHECRHGLAQVPLLGGVRGGFPEHSEHHEFTNLRSRLARLRGRGRRASEGQPTPNPSQEGNLRAGAAMTFELHRRVQTPQVSSPPGSGLGWVLRALRGGSRAVNTKTARQVSLPGGCDSCSVSAASAADAGEFFVRRHVHDLELFGVHQPVVVFFSAVFFAFGESFTSKPKSPSFFISLR